MKLVLPEAESDALFQLLEEGPVGASCEIALVEVLRAVRRSTSDPRAHRQAAEIFAHLHLVRIDRDLLAEAALLEPVHLRALDALHLAAALSFGDELSGFVAYDGALASAAAQTGLRVLAPANRQ